MKHKTPTAELLRMTVDELRRDLNQKRAEVAKMRLGLDAQSEKNSGLYGHKRRDIARMTMVLHRLGKGHQGDRRDRSDRGTSVPSDTSATSAPSNVSVPSEKASKAAKKAVKDSGSKSKKS